MIKAVNSNTRVAPVTSPSTETLAFQFGDLSIDVFDLENMAKLAASVVDDLLDQEPRLKDYPHLVFVDDFNRDTAIFAVQHLQDMATAFKRRYFEIFEQMPIKPASGVK